MAVLLGLAAGITYGAADFCGGLATRRAHVLSVVLISELIGTAPLVAIVPFFWGTGPDPHALGWAIGTGVSGAFGIIAFYRGLAKGRMGVIAPTTAVIAAIVPVVASFLLGERPGDLAGLGIVVALVAVTLISITKDEGGGRMASGLPEALVAALFFGSYFVCLDKAGDAAALWPLVWSRLTSIGLVAIAAMVVRPSFRLGSDALPITAGAGLLDLTANILFLASARLGLLAIAAVLTSLYPASTVLLARVALKERLNPIQRVGLAFAAAGIVLIALP